MKKSSTKTSVVPPRSSPQTRKAPLLKRGREKTMMEIVYCYLPENEAGQEVPENDKGRNFCSIKTSFHVCQKEHHIAIEHTFHGTPHDTRRYV